MNKLTLFGGIVILFMLTMAILAPLLTSYDPTEIDIEDALVAPSHKHILGTDQLGRDIFSRMVFGARISLTIGFVAVGIAAVIGIALGSIAGYFGGRIDSIIMRFVDIMLCFPSFFLILAVVAIIGPNIYNIMIVIGFTSWMGMARLIRAEILSLKERDFVAAAKVLGANSTGIIVRHLIPNGIGPVLVSFVFGVAAAVLVEAGLSFLGLGIQPPTPSWGNILIEGKATLGVAWWLILFPGLAILITVLAFNLLGEGLRDLLNPKGRG